MRNNEKENLQKPDIGENDGEQTLYLVLKSKMVKTKWIKM